MGTLPVETLDFVDEDQDGVSDDEDCDDSDPTAHPEANEVCDGKDNDCDGEVDEPDAIDATQWFQDLDDDGFGADTESQVECDTPGPDWTVVAGDCDDTNPEVNPGADEVCGDGLDNDCDGTANGCGLDGELDASDADVRVAFTNSGGVATWDVIDDLDGDAKSELLLGLQSDEVTGDNAGRILLLEDPLSLVSSADATSQWIGPAEGSYTYTAAGGGDFDGDGTPDIAIGSRGLSSDTELQAGGVYLIVDIAPGTTDLRTVRPLATGEYFEELFGISLSLDQDLDGDGLADLVVGAPGASYTAAHSGAARLYLGSTDPGRLQEPEDALWLGPDEEGVYAGSEVLALGDVDGDGRGEVLVSAPYGSGGQGLAYLVDATLTGVLHLEADALAWWQASDSSRPVSDVDGDGYADMLLGVRKSGSDDLHLLPGGPDVSALQHEDRVATFEDADDWTWSRRTAAPADDLNGDGYSEVLYVTRSSTSVVFYGPVQGTFDPSDADATLQVSGRDTVGGCQDIDGDGFDDLFAIDDGLYLFLGGEWQ